MKNLAQYVPTTPVPEALFDWQTLGLVVLALMGVALAAVAGYWIAVGVAKRVIAYFAGADERRARKIHAMTMSKPKNDIPF